MLALRRHMRGCLQCRAALREARSVPARVAALAPVGAVLIPVPGRLHVTWSWLHERFASLALRGQEVAEMAAAHKAVAVAASAAALAAGGAAAVNEIADRGRAPEPARRAAVVKPAAAQAAPALRTTLASTQPQPQATTRRRTKPRRERRDRRRTLKPAATPAPSEQQAPMPAAPGPEFEAAPAPAPAPAPPPEPTNPQPAPSGSADGEFAP
jgi:hypothetical protein